MVDRFAYAPIDGRPPIRWPEGRRLAVWVVPNVEHYEFLPSTTGVRNPWPRSTPPDALNYPRREYGNRVGLDRLFEVTDRLGVRCTVSLSLSVPIMFPELFAEMRRRQWDYLCHGLYNTHYLWNCPLDEERAFVADCQRRMVDATGAPIRGWFSPACSHTLNTADLLAEAGIDYYCDLYHDDQPFPVRTRSGSLISVPYSMDVNDVVLHVAGADGDAFAHVILDQFETLYDESARSGRVMCIACHPYVTGQPHRIRAFEQALRHVIGHDDVWMATGSEIAQWYRAHHLAEMTHWLEAQR
jgi:peptidoglycan/xylan/chitin deacetylase (PgdA/CDA1 family)